VKEMLASLKAKKDELTNTWTNLDQGLPKMMESIKSRVGILSQSKKLLRISPKKSLRKPSPGLITL